jgi:hypothetical protein
MDTGIGVNPDTFGGETLGAVAGDGVANGRNAGAPGHELDLAVVIEPAAIRVSN